MSNASDLDALVPAVAFNRRGFLATALGAGFALATQPIMAQTAIHTGAEGLTAGPIQVPAADGPLAAYRAQPAIGANFPTILVVSEIFGVHEYIADVCRRLAKLGYQAIAPELFARYGDPRNIADIQQILTTIVSKVPDREALADLDACAAWAAKNGGDPSRLGITGFCWGGRITWLYADHNPKLKAAVAWYGRLSGPVGERNPRHPLDIAAGLKVPVLGLYGGKDPSIPAEEVELMRQVINEAGGKSELVVYPEAPHAFHADYRPTYRPEAAQDGWRRMREWFVKYGL